MSNARPRRASPPSSGTSERKMRAAATRSRETRRTVAAVAAGRKNRDEEPDPCSAFDTGSCGSCRREVAEGAAQCCAECLDEKGGGGGGGGGAPTVQCRRVPAPGSLWCREHQMQCRERVERYKSVEREYEAATPKARGLFRELIGAAPFRFERWAGLSAHTLDRAEHTVRVARARRVESHRLCHAHCSDREHEHVIRRYAEWLVEFRAYRRQRDERRRRAVESAEQERAVARERAFERFGIGEETNGPEYGERKSPPTKLSERRRSRETSHTPPASAPIPGRKRTSRIGVAGGGGGGGGVVVSLGGASESVRSRRGSGSDSDGKGSESGVTSGSDTGRESGRPGNASTTSGAESAPEEEEEEDTSGSAASASSKSAKERERARAKKSNRKKRERARQEEEHEARSTADRLRRLYNEPELRLESLAAPPSSRAALVTTLGVRQWRATAPGLIDRPIRVRYPDTGAPAYLYQRADTTPDRVYIRRGAAAVAAVVLRRGSARTERRVTESIGGGSGGGGALEPSDLPREITADDEAELKRAETSERDTPTHHVAYGVRDNENLTRLLAYLRLVFADRDPDVLATRSTAMAAVGHVRPFTFDAYVGFFEYAVMRWATQQMVASGSAGDSKLQPLESRRALAFVDVASIRYEGMDDTVRALVELAMEHTKAVLLALLTDEVSGVGETRRRQQQQQQIDDLVAQQPEDALDVFYLLRDPALPKREQALRSYVFVTLLGIALQRVRVLASINYAVLDSEFERATQVPVRSSATGQVRYVAPPSLVPEYLGRAAVSSHTHPIDADVLASVSPAATTVSASSPAVAPPPARSTPPPARKKNAAAAKSPPPPPPPPPPSQLSSDPFASLNPAAVYSPVILRPVSHDPNWRPESSRLAGRKTYASQLSPYEFASIHPAAL